MNNYNESHSTIYNLQKKIIELSREYYQAIKENITFENVKIIFLKRKKLKEELSSIKQTQNNTRESFEEENLNSSLSFQD